MLHDLRRLVQYYGLFGSRGVLAGAKATLAMGTPEFEVRAKGVRHPFYLRLRTSDVPTYRQIFVSAYYDLTVQKEPRTIIDAGANIGLTAIYFSRSSQQKFGWKTILLILRLTFMKGHKLLLTKLS